LIENNGWAELLRSFGTQRSTGIKYGVTGITPFTNYEHLLEEDCPDGPPISQCVRSIIKGEKHETARVYNC
jgi:hypothetical protein